MKRFPLRGGNWNNGANAGLGYLNLNNSRVNANSNIGFRPASDKASSTHLKGSCPCTIEKDAASAAGAEILNDHAGAPAVCLYEQIYQFENLYQAAQDCRRGKTRKPATLRYFDNLEENLIQLQNELIWDEYQPLGRRQFYVFEPKRRLIHAPSFYDRVCQRAIYNVIIDLVDKRFIDDSYACRKGKGTHACANRAQTFIRKVEAVHGKAMAFKADISKYFSSIKHMILKALLPNAIPCPRLLDLIYLIIDHSPAETPGVGVSLGELLNQVHANLYMHELDFFAKHTLKVKFYARYMDDFIIIHHDKEQLQAWRKEIEWFLWAKLRLQTNSKTQIFPIGKRHGRALDFVGYRIYSSHKLLRKCSVKRIKINLKLFRRRYAAGTMSAAEINPRIQSWIGHASHANTYNLRKSLFEIPFRRESYV